MSFTFGKKHTLNVQQVASHRDWCDLEKYPTEMLFGGKNKVKGSLNPHLEEIDRQAQEMEQHLISQLAQQEGVTEQLKAENQMNWVARRTSIRHRADEIVLNELIYA